MSFVDDFKTSLREIKDFLTKTAYAAADELSRISDDTRLRYKIYQLRRQLGQLHQQLGTEVYHLHSEKRMGKIDEEEKVASLIQRIRELELDIKKKEEERQKLRTTQATNMEKEPENQTLS